MAITLEEVSSALAAYVPLTSMKENYTLDRMRALLAHLSNPQESFPCIHIAGTSGKTSVAYFVAGLLRGAGAKTGLTVSPFVKSITERVQINGPLADQMFADYMDSFLPRVRDTGLQPTYFEVLVAFAFDVFRSERVDYGIIETGLGGLSDATNVITRPDKVVVITDIGLDHTEILGDTVEEIAAQKAGIVQPGNAVLIQGGQDSAVLAVLFETAQARGASRIRLINGAAATLGTDDTPLFQRKNWALARAVVDDVAERDGLCNIADHIPPLAYMPPGRMEVLKIDQRYVILDGAHNPQKLSTLSESLADIGLRRLPVLAALGRTAKLKASACIDIIATFASPLTITDFATTQDMERRSWPAEELAALARARGISDVSAQANSHRALGELLHRPERGLLLTGSLYLLADLRSQLIARGAHTSTISALRAQL